MAQKKYVDLTGLGEFKSKLLEKLAANKTETAYAVELASEASKLSASRNVAFATGDVTGNFDFDGSADVANVALSIGEGKVTNAMLAGDIETSKISGLDTALEKLEGIAEGAQVNVIENFGWKQSGAEAITWVSPAEQDSKAKAVVLDLSGYALKSEISAAINFKGIVASSSALPTSGEAGDVYYVKDTSSEYIWVPAGDEVTAHFEQLGPSVDYSIFALAESTINGKAIGNADGSKVEVVLSGADILATGYAEASAVSDVEATDSINVALGKVEKKADVNATAIEGLQNGAKSYAFAEGDENGTFKVTEIVGETAGTAQPISIKGLDSAFFTKFDGIEEGAEVNAIEVVKVNDVALEIDSTDRSVNVVIPAATVTDVQVKTASADFTTALDGTVAKIDLSAYALDADIIALTTDEIDSLF